MTDLTPAQKEAIYDAEIAPVLLQLTARCKEAGLSFLASVEWAPGESGSTVHLEEHRGWAQEIACVAGRSNGNADAVILHMMKMARERGHSSVCLHRLGVPTGEPAP